MQIRVHIEFVWVCVHHLQVSITQPVGSTSHMLELLAMSKRLVTHRISPPAIAFASSPGECRDPCMSDQMLRCLGGCTAIITTLKCIYVIALCPAWALSAYMICDSDEKFCRKPAALGSRHLASFAVSLCFFTIKCWHIRRLRPRSRCQVEDTGAVKRRAEGFDKAEQ